MAREPNTPSLPQALRSAFGSLVFPELNAAGRNTSITSVLRGLTTADRSRLQAIRRGIEQDRITIDHAAEHLAALVVGAWLVADIEPEPKDARLDHLNRLVSQIAESDPALLVSAVRTFAGVANASEAAKTEELQKKIETEIVVIGTPNPNTNNTEDGTMLTDAQIQEATDKLAQFFVFNESKLPDRLHYATDAHGNKTLGDGQRNLIAGVLQALVKLGLWPGAEEHRLAIAASTLGLLLQDGFNDPDVSGFYGSVRDVVNELNSAAADDHGDRGNNKFESDFTLRRDVFLAVGKVLVGDNDDAEVFVDSFAAVGRSMVDAYDTIKPEDAGFSNTVKARYDNETLKLGGTGGGGSGVAFLDLPPLNGGGNSDDIVRENILAVSSIYVVYQCEQMMLFNVVDRIVELFMAGLLPMQGDTTARNLDNYYWDRDEKVSPTGRSAQYTRALGAPGGDTGGDVTPNSEFNSLLMRVVSSVSEFERQNSVGNLLDSSRSRVMATSGEYVRKAVRDLGANATLYGFAGTQFAAERMGRQLKQAMDILQLPRVREIYGVNNMWQVIERVAQSEFGTTVNVVKHRTLAEETRKIMGVIADNADIWSLSSSQPLFTTQSGDDQKADLDWDQSQALFRATQYFLAVNGVQSDQVYEYSQPVDTPALPTIPGMGAFGGDAGGMPGAGSVDVSGAIKDMLNRGETPSAEKMRSLVGI